MYLHAEYVQRRLLCNQVILPFVATQIVRLLHQKKCHVVATQRVHCHFLNGKGSGRNPRPVGKRLPKPQQELANAISELTDGLLHCLWK